MEVKMHRISVTRNLDLFQAQVNEAITLFQNSAHHLEIKYVISKDDFGEINYFALLIISPAPREDAWNDFLQRCLKLRQATYS